MRSHEHLFIGGGWVSPATAERIEVRSPATEELIGRRTQLTVIRRTERLDLEVVPQESGHRNVNSTERRR